MDLKEAGNNVDPDISWYYRSKSIPLHAAFERFAGPAGEPVPLVDFGAGSGFFGKTLLKRYPGKIEQVHLVDIGYAEAVLGPDDSGRIVRSRRLPELSQPTFVVAMDVLEHVPDDREMLRDLVERIPSGSSLFVTVPAFRSLWSRHDEVLGHHRRYRLSGLRSLCEAEGLTVLTGRYLYAALFPLVAVARFFRRGSTSNQSDLRPLPPVLNQFLFYLSRAEMRMVRWNPFLGVTAMVEAKKTGDSTDG